MRGMLAEMTASEFAGWAAFYSLEPWGHEADWFRTGVVSSTIANMSGRVMRDGQRSKPDDFIPQVQQPAKPADVVERIKAAFGYGKDRR